MPAGGRGYTYQHNITINYTEVGAENLGKNLTSMNAATTKTTKSTADMNQQFAKSTKSTKDATKEVKNYGTAAQTSAKSQQTFTDSTKKSEQAQSGFGTSLRRNRGLLFGATGLSSSLVEAAGMYGIYTDALVRKNEAQAEVNRLEKEGMQGTKDYSDAQQELQQQTRAFTMFQRNMALSMFDTVTFVTMLASSLLPRLSKETLMTAGRFLTLGQAFKANNTAMMSSAIPTFTAGLTPIAPAVVKTTGALGGLRAMLTSIGLTNPFFIAITLAGALLAAVALNVGGLRDRINELGKSLGDALPFLKPLLDAMGSLGDILGGGVAEATTMVTDKYGNLTVESEKLRASTQATDLAFQEMFANLERVDVSNMLNGFNDLLNKMKVDVGQPASFDIVGNTIKMFKDWTGATKDEIKKAKDNIAGYWIMYGDDISGAKMFTQAGEDAKQAFIAALTKLIGASDAEFPILIADVEEKWRLFKDQMSKQVKDENFSDQLFILDENTINQGFQKATQLTKQGYANIMTALRSYNTQRSALMKQGRDIDDKAFVDSITNLSEKEKKALTEYISLYRKFYDEEMQMKQDQLDELAKAEEDAQKEQLDNKQKYLDLQADLEAQRQEDIKVNSEQFALFTGNQIKLEQQYNKEVATLTKTQDINSLSVEQQVKIAGQLFTKYQALGLEGITWVDVLADITKSTEKATEKAKTYSQALAETVKMSEDAGARIMQSFRGVIGEELFDQGDDKNIDTKMKKDVGKIAKKLGLTKKGARKIMIPMEVSFMISNESAAVDSINEAIAILTDHAANHIKPEDLTMLNDKYWENFKKAFKSSGGTGVKSKDEAVIGVINDAMKVDWDDLSPEEAISKLQEIKKKLTDAGFKGEDDTANPLSDGINKDLGLIATPPEVQTAIETPIVTAFNNIAVDAESMETDLAFSFEFISGDADTTSTEIQDSFNTGFDAVIDKGQELEGKLEDNFDTIWSSVDDLISKVEDLSSALEDIPNITRTITIKRKVTGSGGGSGGGIFNSIFTNAVREGGIIGMQHGGIIDEAQIYRGVRIGEHNKPEAVIPLSNPNNLADKALNIQAPINFHFQLDGGKVLKPIDIWETVSPRMGKYMSNYGGN